MKGKFLVLLLSIVVIWVLITLTYKENGLKTYPLYKTSSIQGFHLTHKEEGKARWEFMAENATFPEGNKEIVLKNLSIMVHHDSEFILTGGSGVYNIQEKNLVINSPVEIDIEGAKLTTDSLTWNGKEELITTPNGIKLKGKNFQIEGTGLTAKIRDQQLRIQKNVKGVFYR